MIILMSSSVIIQNKTTTFYNTISITSSKVRLLKLNGITEI